MTQPLEYYVKEFHASVTDFENYLFFELPGINGPKWDKKM